MAAMRVPLRPSSRTRHDSKGTGRYRVGRNRDGGCLSVVGTYKEAALALLEVDGSISVLKCNDI